MAEELIMNVKSNIKSVTKDTQDLNSTLEEQKDILLELKKEEIKLQQERAKMSDYERSISGVDKKLEHLKFSIKDQTLAVKGLTEQQNKANKAQKEQDQAIKGTIGNFRIFGVSLNGIKKSVSGIIPLIKLMFKSITAGIMSTGIGVLLIAFGSLVTYVTSTKEGMDKLNVVIAKISAAFNVIKDRISGFGKIIGKVFTGKLGLIDAVKETKENFADMGEEMKVEVKLAGELEKATQKLRDVENEFIVTRAKKNQQLAEARLLSEDETTSLQERRLALEDAIKLEKQILQDELDNQAERVRILAEKTEMSNSSAADEKALAEAKVDLINLETKSLTTQKRLKREMNALDNEILADEKRIADEKQAIFDAKQELRSFEDAYDAEQKKKREKNAADEIALAKKVEKEKIAIDNAIFKSKIAIGQAIGDSIGALGDLMREGSAAAKTMALTEIAVNTGVGFVQALNIAQKSAAATGPLAAYAFPVFYATQVLAVLGAAAQAKQILGAGGGTTPPSIPDANQQTPAPQMMQGAFTLGGGLEPEPARAYVVSDDITNNQNKLAIIRRRATI